MYLLVTETILTKLFTIYVIENKNDFIHVFKLVAELLSLACSNWIWVIICYYLAVRIRYLQRFMRQRFMRYSMYEGNDIVFTVLRHWNRSCTLCTRNIYGRLIIDLKVH